MAAVCPVIGTTTTVLPPSHPALNHDDPTARCPVTNATISHHDAIIHSHPDAASVPSGPSASDATKCPALKNANSSATITDATCPVVGPVTSVLPPKHPQLSDKDAGAVCPVTNATMEHHKSKVHAHPGVSGDADASACPVAGQKVTA